MTCTKMFTIVLCLSGLCAFPQLAGSKEPDASATVSVTVPSPGDGASYDGEQALDLGQYQRAEGIFRTALKQGGKDKPYLQLGLAEALLNQGKLADAAREYKKAESLIDRASASDELKARLYDGLSWVAQLQGKMADAQSLCQKSLSIRKGSSTADQAMLVQTLMHMARILEMQGQLGQSLPYYQDASKLEKKLSGPGSLVSADIDEKAASILRRLGNANKAQELFQRSLQTKLSKNAPQMPYSPHPHWQNVTLRFMEGSPNCMLNSNQGTDQEIVAGNGITVSAAFRAEPIESVKSSEVRLTVRNDSDKEIQFLPIPPTLIVLKPKLAIAPQVDPSKLANTVEKKGERKASWIRFWGEGATQTVTTTMMGQPGFWGYPPIYSYGGAMPIVTGGGGFTQVMSQVPDYAAQARALAKAAAVSQGAKRKADYIKSTGLGPAVIPPGQAIGGSLFFDTTKVTRAVLRVPIGNAVFEFTFPAR